MVLTQTCKILFYPNESRKNLLTLTTVSEFFIETSYTNLTQKAEIKIARRVKDFDRFKVRDVFRRGDKVEIYLGYNNDLKLEFKGYITHVSADIPISIKLEDEMSQLKKQEVNFSDPNITLKQLIAKIIPNPKYKINITYDAQFGKVMFAKTNVGDVLQKIKDDWKIHSYFRLENDEPILEISSIYQVNDKEKPHLFHLERNCVSQQLNYRRKEDIKIKIKGLAVLPKGKNIKVEFGDKEGDIQQLTYYDKTQHELEILVRKDYERFKQDGMEGSFTALGIPSAKFGEKARIISYLYEDRNGTFGIEGINKTFNKNGYRQDIKLGFKIGEK